jgi:hypothetical protein
MKKQKTKQQIKTKQNLKHIMFFKTPRLGRQKKKKKNGARNTTTTLSLFVT